MESTNAYKVLGLRKGCSDAEIKAAWTELIRKYDQEKHTDRFIAVQKSYETLRDPAKRAREDILTFNFVRGQFLFTRDEQVDTPDGQIRQAILAAEQEYQSDPESIDCKNGLMKTLMVRSFKKVSKRLWAEAMEDWKRVIEIDSTHQRAKNNLLYAYITLGYSYAEHGLYSEAAELWEQALRMNPDDMETIHNLAVAYEMADRKSDAHRYWEETLKRWQEALDKNPDDAYLRQSIIEVRRHHGGKAAPGATKADKAASIQEYREILKINPDDFEAKYKIATSLMEEQKWAEAQQALEELGAKFPRNLEVLNLLGTTLLNGGHIDKAFQMWNRSLTIDPKNTGTREAIIRARMSLGKAFRNRGMYTQSLVNFKALLRYLPQSPEVYMEIGQTYMAKGDKRSAASAFERVMQLDPKNRDARQRISDMKLR
jgi:tetratricopeptide (TPR) repeat protein